MANDQKSICGYIAASNATPGIIAVNDPTVSAVTSTHVYNAFQYTLTSLGVVSAGKNVPILFTVENISASPFEAFIGYPEVFVHVVKDGTEAWNPYFGMAFPAGFRQSTFPAGTLNEYDFSWDQRDNSGNQVSPGSYTVEASFLYHTEKVDITIQ